MNKFSKFIISSFIVTFIFISIIPGVNANAFAEEFIQKREDFMKNVKSITDFYSYCSTNNLKYLVVYYTVKDSISDSSDLYFEGNLYYDSFVDYYAVDGDIIRNDDGSITMTDSVRILGLRKYESTHPNETVQEVHKGLRYPAYTVKEMTFIPGTEINDPNNEFDFLGIDYSKGLDLGEQLNPTYLTPKDCKENTMGFVYPTNVTKLGGRFYKESVGIPFKLVGKVSYDDGQANILPNFSYAVELHVKQEICDNLKFKSSFGEFTCAMPLIQIYGTRDDWSKNGYYYFSVTGTIQVKSSVLKRVGSNIDFQAQCSVTNKVRFFLMNDYDNITIKSNKVNPIVEYYKDVDGDGADDNSGLTIPDYGIIDNDGDGTPDYSFDETLPDGGSSGGGSSGGSSDESSSNIIDYLNSIVRSIQRFFELVSDTLKTISNTVISIPNYISNILNVFPEPIPQMAVSAIAILIFVSVLKFLRG